MHLRWSAAAFWPIILRRAAARTLCSFAGMEDSVLNVLPAAPGIGIAFQMRDGTTRVVRMSEALEAHLRQEWTSFVLSNAADVKGEEVLRILFYQDKKQVPLTALLEKRWVKRP